mgnify:CR=1 FL=1
MQIRLQKYSALILTLLLSACASQQVAVSESIKLESAKAADSATFTPEQAIEDATKQLANAKEQGLDYYSPLHLSQASESIEEAKAYILEPPKKIKNAALMSAIAAQRFIADAHKNKATVLTTLTKVFTHQKILVELKAPDIVSEQYNDIVTDIGEMINYIERGKMSDVSENLVELKGDMALVEINTLKKVNLDLADNFLDKAKDIDADDFAAVSLKNAKNMIKKANTYIEKNYRNRKGVVNVGEKALWEAKKAYYVAQEAKKLNLMDEESAEKHTLLVYTLLNNAYEAAYGKSIEPQDLNSSSDALVSMVEDLKAGAEKAKRALEFYVDKNTVKPTKSVASELPEEEQLEIQSLAPIEPSPEPALELKAEPITEPVVEKAVETTSKLDEDGFEMME